MCGAKFNRKFNFNVHERVCESLEQKAKAFVCFCGSKFKRKYLFDKHKKSCLALNDSRDDPSKKKSDAETHFREKSHKHFECPVYHKSFISAEALVKHENDSGHVMAGSSKSEQCRCHACGLICPNRKELYAHKTKHYQTEEVEKAFQPEPWKQTGSSPPWEQDGVINEDLKTIYRQHRHLILKQRKSEGRVSTSYNFPVDDSISVDDMISHIEEIYQESDVCFKINVSLGIILQEINQGTYRYFVPYHNETLLTVPMYIRNRRGLDRLRIRLSQLDIAEYAKRQRPNTKWKPVMLTNVVNHVYKTSYPLGLSKGLPKYIKNCKSIVSFERRKRDGQIYFDDLCFFRCLAYHIKKKLDCERLTKKLFKQWVKFARVNKMRSYLVPLDRMPALERCFSTNINVFSLKQNKTKP